jgi:hypothetical protein
MFSCVQSVSFQTRGTRRHSVFTGPLKIDILPMLTYWHILTLLMMFMQQTVWNSLNIKRKWRKRKKLTENVEVNGKVIWTYRLSRLWEVRLSTYSLLKRVALEADINVSEENAASIFRVKLIRVKTRLSSIRAVTRSMLT